MSVRQFPSAITFNELLVHGRTARGLTQRDLAARVGVTSSYIAGLEAGETVPSPARVGELARVLRLDAAQLAHLVVDAKVARAQRLAQLRAERERQLQARRYELLMR